MVGICTKWSVSDTKVIKLKKLAKNKYQITGLKAGTAKVYAKLGSKKYVCTVTVKAAGTSAVKVPGCVAKQTISGYGYKGSNGLVINKISLPNCFIFIKNLDANAKVTDVTSSNPYIRAYKRVGMDAIEVCDNIPVDGQYLRDINLLDSTSIIRFKVVQNKKTYNLSCNITVKAAESPFSSFKIGDYELASEFLGCDWISINLLTGNENWVNPDILAFKLNGKQKISIKMTSGYILDSAFLKIGTGNSQQIKNGSVVDFDIDSGGADTSGIYDSGTCGFNFSIYYHTTKKPANYKEPKVWDAVVDSPLHNLSYIWIK